MCPSSEPWQLLGRRRIVDLGEKSRGFGAAKGAIISTPKRGPFGTSVMAKRRHLWARVFLKRSSLRTRIRFDLKSSAGQFANAPNNSRSFLRPSTMTKDEMRVQLRPVREATGQSFALH